MKTLYICEGCGSQHSTAASALACERQDPGPLLVQVGDVVYGNSGFGWYNGEESWVVNPQVMGKPKDPAHGNCFDTCCTMQFFYVVGSVDTHLHRVRYHLFSLAMRDATGYGQGYTYNEHHITPVPVAHTPAHVVAAAGQFKGRKAERLL